MQSPIFLCSLKSILKWNYYINFGIINAYKRLQKYDDTNLRIYKNHR